MLNVIVTIDLFHLAYTVVSAVIGVAKSNGVSQAASEYQPANSLPTFIGAVGSVANPLYATSCALTSVPPFVLNVTV